MYSGLFGYLLLALSFAPAVLAQGAVNTTSSSIATTSLSSANTSSLIPVSQTVTVPATPTSCITTVTVTTYCSKNVCKTTSITITLPITTPVTNYTGPPPPSTTLTYTNHSQIIGSLTTPVVPTTTKVVTRTRTHCTKEICTVVTVTETETPSSTPPPHSQSVVPPPPVSESIRPPPPYSQSVLPSPPVSQSVPPVSQSVVPPPPVSQSVQPPPPPYSHSISPISVSSVSTPTTIPIVTSCSPVCWCPCACSVQPTSVQPTSSAVVNHTGGGQQQVASVGLTNDVSSSKSAYAIGALLSSLIVGTIMLV